MLVKHTADDSRGKAALGQKSIEARLLPTKGFVARPVDFFGQSISAIDQLLFFAVFRFHGFDDNAGFHPFGFEELPDTMGAVAFAPEITKPGDGKPVVIQVVEPAALGQDTLNFLPTIASLVQFGSQLTGAVISVAQDPERGIHA